MALYPRKALPGNMKKHVAKLRRDKNEKNILPKWLDDDKVRDRILRVYAMYIARHTLPQIMSAEHISVPQIYKDLGRAREMRKLLFQKDIEHMLMEQVEAHRIIIIEARRALGDLRRGMTVKIPVTPTADELTSEDDKEHEDREMTVKEPTPARARAEADLLRVVAENEKMIEELLGLRDREKKGPGEGDEPPIGGTTIIIDARTQNLNVKPDEVSKVVAYQPKSLTQR